MWKESLLQLPFIKKPGWLRKAFLNIQHADRKEASFKVPSDAKVGNTIHIILEGKDNGKPTLTRYQRVILTVE